MGMFASSEVFVFEGFRLDRRGGGLFRRDDSGACRSGSLRLARARHSRSADRTRG